MSTIPGYAVVPIILGTLLLLICIVQVVKKLSKISARERDLEERLRKHLEGK